MSETQLLTTRDITLYSNISNSKRVINTAAQTWGELKLEFSRLGIPYNGMSAIMENENELISDNSSLMPGAHMLFLLPSAVKSGSKVDLDDQSLIDWEKGLSWNEINWGKTPVISLEEQVYKTSKDLAISRIIKAQYYLSKVLDFLTSPVEGDAPMTQEEINKMNEIAKRTDRKASAVFE